MEHLTPKNMNPTCWIVSIEVHWGDADSLIAFEDRGDAVKHANSCAMSLVTEFDINEFDDYDEDDYLFEVDTEPHSKVSCEDFTITITIASYIKKENN